MSQMLKCFCNLTGCAGREVSKRVFDTHRRPDRADQARKHLEASERVLKEDEALSASSFLPPSRYQALFNLGFLVCLFHLFRKFPTSQNFLFPLHPVNPLQPFSLPISFILIITL